MKWVDINEEGIQANRVWLRIHFKVTKSLPSRVFGYVQDPVEEKVSEPIRNQVYSAVTD